MTGSSGSSRVNACGCLAVIASGVEEAVDEDPAFFKVDVAPSQHQRFILPRPYIRARQYRGLSAAIVSTSPRLLRGAIRPAA